MDNPGLLIPRYKALGRTAPNGKVYPDTPIARENEDDLVPVRSIVTKRKGDLSVITPDLIGKKFKDFTPGAAIGLSFATSFTESTTQGALGLKHGKLMTAVLKLREIAGRDQNQISRLFISFNDYVLNKEDIVLIPYASY